MKKLFIPCLFAIGAISCSSCRATTVSQPDVNIPDIVEKPEVAPPITQIFSGARWEIEIPVDWHAVDEPDPHVKLLRYNSEKKNMIVFTQEDFSGSFEEYSVLATRILTNNGAHLLSTKPVTINGNKYQLFVAEKGKVTAWSWITVKDGFGYALTCAGQSIDIWNQNICMSIADTLKIK